MLTEQEIDRMKTKLRHEIDALRAELKERNAALPAHSVRPDQIMAIEALEDEIAAKEKELEQLKELEGGRKTHAGNR